MFKVTEIDQNIVESTILENQYFTDSIYECEFVVIILDEPLKDDTDEH